MQKIMFASLLSLACAFPVWGDVKAQIDGPSRANPGDLVVLSGMSSVGDGFRWITPESVQSIACGDQLQLAWASGTPGEYTFILIVASKEAEIDYATHVVTVGKAAQPPEKPDQPDEPTPTPSPLIKLEKLSRELANRIDDRETSVQLRRAILAVDLKISAMCEQAMCPGLGTAKAMFVAEIESTLLARTGSSRDKNWLDGWRKPMDEQIKMVNPQDVPAYQAVMRALAEGLR